MVNLKDPQNKEFLLSTIDKISNDIKAYLLDLTKGDEESYHRAALLCYWIPEYLNILKRENAFDPSFQKKYNRGDIVSVNFGYRLGSELGGLHYAVVIEDCARRSPNIVVIPLRSRKPKDNNGIHLNDVDLGDELYIKFNTKIHTVVNKLSDSISEVRKQRKEFEDSIAKLSTAITELAGTQSSQVAYEAISSVKESAEAKMSELDKAEENLKNIKTTFFKSLNEFRNMKHGSIALVQQITSVSKMRILNPISSEDPLADICLSSQRLDMIDEKIQKLFTR